jgi:tripeptidyl-peptidase-1
MSSETQPLLNETSKHLTSSIPSDQLSNNNNNNNKPRLLWYQDTKYLVIGIITLIIIIGSIFIYSGYYHGTLLSKHNNDLNELTSIETVTVSPSLSEQWKWSSSCSDDESIELTFAIKQQNIDQLTSILNDISNPKSKNYGQYYTIDSIHELLKPSDDSLNTIKTWLLDYVNEDEIKSVTPNSDFLRIKTTIEKANKLLNTQYGIWTNSNGEQHIRVKDNYYVPKSVGQHLDFVSPTLRFPLKKHVKTQAYISSKSLDITSDKTSYVTPTTLKALYDYPDDVSASSTSGNAQCVASFLEEYYDDDDLSLFWETYEIEETTMIREPLNQEDGYGSEAELDVQYITSMGEQITTYVWEIEDDGYFISLVEEILDSDVMPYVVSMSYGGDEQSNGYEYCSRANTEFAKASALGITFFASSGDTGAAGEETCGEDGEYLPSFPASSPYVTAVGGTYGGKYKSVNEDIESYFSEEEGWYYSGGGFSVYFDREDWQADAVNNYLNNEDVTLPDSDRYSSTGRGYPDISAQSEYFIIAYEGAFYSVSGTSCSCPTIAGMFAMINDIRLSNGKTTLGWLNPSLYGLYTDQSKYFNDIEDGTNEGCDSDDGVGFESCEGWDPVTGLGTPKLSKLFDYFTNL